MLLKCYGIVKRLGTLFKRFGSSHDKVLFLGAGELVKIVIYFCPPYSIHRTKVGSNAVIDKRAAKMIMTRPRTKKIT